MRLYDPREIELPDVGPLLHRRRRDRRAALRRHARPGFRRRFGRRRRGARPSCSGVPAGRGRCRVAVHRRGPASGDRAVAARRKRMRALSMSFIWPPLLLLLLAIPVGVWAIDRASGRGRRGWRSRVGVVGGRGGVGRPRLGHAVAGAAPAGVAGRAAFTRRASRSWSSRSPDPRASSACRGSRARSSSPSMSPGAWPPPTSRRPASRRPRPRPSPSSRSQPPSVRIGIVTFSDTGFSTQVPTDDRVAVEAAIHRLEPQRGHLRRPGHPPVAGRHRRRRQRGCDRLLHEPRPSRGRTPRRSPPARTSRPSSCC